MPTTSSFWGSVIHFSGIESYLGVCKSLISPDLFLSPSGFQALLFTVAPVRLFSSFAQRLRLTMTASTSPPPSTVVATAAATAAVPSATIDVPSNMDLQKGVQVAEKALGSAPNGNTGDGSSSSISAEKAPEKGPQLPAVLTTPADPFPGPYYFEGGLRRVEPYHYTYTTYCKERWRNRQLIDIFDSEFRDRPLEYYRRAMEGGEVAVNSKTVGPHYVLKNGDCITHTLHRHEPPVTADPIAILHEDNDMIVLNKPSGVPVHPSGRYRYNSVTEIMKSERGVDWMAYPCNRLDRLTSGIMFIAKNPKAAVTLGRQIEARTVRKEYIARVIGRFPDGEVVCDQPILAISPKLGLNRVRANGKHARTVFKRLAYYPPREDEDVSTGSAGTDNSSTGGGGVDASVQAAGAGADSSAAASASTTTATTTGAGGSSIGGDGRPWTNKKGYSIVRCLPVTGRTHQLRVHLQFLGHPIQNDPIYANQKVWGFDLGCNDDDATRNSDEDIISRLSRMGKEDVASAVAYYDEVISDYEKKRAEKMSGKLCDICQTPLYTDPGLHELELWLHSLRYEDKDGAWQYVSPLPAWALPPEGYSGPTEVGGLDELVDAVKDSNPEIVAENE